MRSLHLLILSLAAQGNAYAWMANIDSESVDSVKTEQHGHLEKRASICPVHLIREGAAPYSKYYPSAYTGAENGLPGTGKGGVLVPARGDKAHAYKAPGSRDIRGPCPALNMAANHHFISHDGITNFTELVDMAQNVFNWGWDLATFVATFGIVMDGDPLTTQLSIGCSGGSSVKNTGLNTHDKFEGDVSMARNDYYLSKTGDNYKVNATIFGYMTDFCDGNFTLDCIGPYMGSRYNQSLHTNGNFFFGPIGLFNFGTATLPQESFASFGNLGIPSVTTIAPFWAVKPTTPGSTTFTANPGHERLPTTWYNRPTALSFPEILLETFSLYTAAGSPSFGGNTGAPNTFVGLNFPAGGIKNGVLQNATVAGIACLFYQGLTDVVPTGLGQLLQIPLAAKVFAEGKLDGIFGQFGCPAV